MIVSDLFTIGIPVADKVIRTVAVYAGIAVLLRVAGKRDLAQLTSFDLVVVLLLSNVVQNAIIGNDDSLLGGLLGAAVLIALNAAVVRAAARSPRISMLVQGRPTVLIRDGKYDDAALRHEGLRRTEVDAALRRQNADGPEQVAEATLSPGGMVIVSLLPEEQGATRGDIDGLARTLDRLGAQVDALAERSAG